MIEDNKDVQAVVENETVATEEVASLEIQEEDEMTKAINEAKKDAKWYVLHTFSGYENVAKENLEIVIEKYKNGIKISEDYVVYDLSAEKISGSSLGSLFKVK